MSMQANNTKPVWMFILQMCRPFTLSLGVMVFTAIVWSIDLSFKPYLLKVILNRVSEYPGKQVVAHVFYPALGFFLMTLLLSCAFRLYDYFAGIKMIPPLRQRISNTMFAHLLKHSHHYYQNNFSGSLANKVTDLADNIPEIMQILIDRFLATILAISIAIFTLWQVNIKFAILIFFWTTLFILVSVLCSKKLQRLSSIWSEYAAAITGRLVDALSNILSIRLFAREQCEKKLFNETLEDTAQAESKLQWFYFLIWNGYGFSFVVMQGLCLYLLIMGRQAGTISVGDFALVLGINIAIVDFMWQFTKDISQFSRHVGKVKQALQSIMIPIEIQDRPHAGKLSVTHGEITFDKVQFNYKGDEPLFENKSITILSGQKVGLVGYSGSGKSTFVNLILRLFEVAEGRILIDNQDIREVTQCSLHEAIGMIPQDPFLFHRTLMENIRYGQIDASDEEVVKAAMRAHAHEFISTLALGYESLVGERGIKLSGGQRQRIAIARAFLKNAPILILDEATSQLDSITESYIQDSLWQLMEGKTTLIIAHRLSTLLRMDRILVFEQGKIVQDGSHSELLKTPGLYKSLWDAQVGGFLLDDVSIHS